MGPDEQYAQYRFVRQPQTFPDVVLKAASPSAGPDILLGIELKGWYVLAKEREPSFRYRVTPAVCATDDLLAVFPWALSRVISGSPQLFTPYVVNARYAAEYRNWHWTNIVRDGDEHGAITLSSVVGNYPSKAQAIGDEPVADKGSNFGRFARTMLMDSFMDELFRDELAGIPLDAWQRFLKLFGEQSPMEKISAELTRMEQAATRARRAAAGEAVQGIKDRLVEIVALLDSLA